jgi:hypothetical protein
MVNRADGFLGRGMAVRNDTNALFEQGGGRIVQRDADRIVPSKPLQKLKGLVEGSGQRLQHLPLLATPAAHLDTFLAFFEGETGEGESMAVLDPMSELLDVRLLLPANLTEAASASASCWKYAEAAPSLSLSFASN